MEKLAKASTEKVLGGGDFLSITLGKGYIILWNDEANQCQSYNMDKHGNIGKFRNTVPNETCGK